MRAVLGVRVAGLGRDSEWVAALTPPDSARVFAIEPPPPGPAGAFAWSGVMVSNVVAWGPLAASSIGHEWADGEVAFVLSLGTVDDSGVVGEIGEVDAQLREAVFEAAKRLETRRLRVVVASGGPMALVWSQGSTDMAVGDWPLSSGFRTSLPEGDGEAMLRRFIDDGVNILSELEQNRRRVDAGVPAANLLWPWGPGRCPDVENAALRRGQPFDVDTDDWAIQGAARLSGATSQSTATFRLLDVRDEVDEDRLARTVCDALGDARGVLIVPEHAPGLGWLEREETPLQPPFSSDLLDLRGLPRPPLARIVDRALAPRA